jgi:hypothetical protein
LTFDNFSRNGQKNNPNPTSKFSKPEFEDSRDDQQSKIAVRQLRPTMDLINFHSLFSKFEHFQKTMFAESSVLTKGIQNFITFAFSKRIQTNFSHFSRKFKNFL